jgi:hypothetical protein
MARPAVEVHGARRLRSTLKAAGVDLADLKAAHAQVAKLVEQRARPRTPNTSGRSTGALAASFRSSGTARAAIVRAGRASVPYAGVIHFGWPGRIRENPWIMRAAEESQNTWEGLYLRALDQIIAQVEGAPGA